MRKTVLQSAVLLCSAIALMPALMPAAGAAADANQPLTELVQRFTEAQGKMDAAALKALTAENYVEVSPLGDVDPRDKMLTFYVKDGKQAPPMPAVDEITPRLLGDTAVVIAKVSYTRVVEGQSRTFSLRSTFVAQKSDGNWKMVSAQYTPIRPPRNPG